MRRTHSLLLAVLLTTVVGAEPAAENPLVQAARNRQKQYRSVLLEYSVINVVSAGGIVNKDEVGNVPRSLPENETRQQSNSRILLSGDQIRAEVTQFAWLPDRAQFKEFRDIAVHSNARTLRFQPDPLSESAPPRGIITDRVDFIPSIMAPFLLLVRGDDSSLSPYRLSKLKPTGNSLEIDGRTCTEYASPPLGGGVDHLWFDPAAGNVVKRIRYQHGATTSDQCDVRYDSDGQLKSWVWSSFSPEGTLRQVQTVEVRKLTTTPEIPVNAFNMEFPPGTSVRDTLSNQTYRVQEDGTWKELVDEATATSIHESTNVLQRLRQSPTLLAVGIALIALVLGVVYRIRTKRTVSRLA